MLSLLRGALTFDSETFAELKRSPDVFRRGFNVVLVVGLIVGLVSAGVGLYQDLLSPPTQPEAVREEIEQGFETALQNMPIAESMEELIRDYFQAGLDIGSGIAEIEPQVGYPAGEFLRSLGEFVSTPFRWLSLLFLYGVLVHFTARIFLGGRGSIQEMLGCTALALAPRIFAVLGPVPYLGLVVGFAVFWWSYAIYVQGVATAHDLTAGKAALAVLLPILVPTFLGIAATAAAGASAALVQWY